MTKKTFMFGYASALALVLGAASSAHAQSGQTGGASTPPSAPLSSGAAAVQPQNVPGGSVAAAGASGGNTVGEIIVTAQKRSEALSRVGLTVTAFSGDQLKIQGISSVADLSRVVPGLTFSVSQASTPVYTLRGVGFNDDSLAAAPDVSVYVDQVPLPFPALTNEAGLDLARVEILKGPQGILFGQNSTGGAVNYIAAKPTKDFEAGADIGYGNYNAIDESAYISGPLTNTLSARLAVKGDNADGWQQSVTRPGDTSGKTQIFAGRLLLDWTPTSWAKFELNINGSINDSDTQAPQFIKLTPEHPNNVPAALASQPLAPANDRAADWSPDHAPKGNEKQYQISLRSDIDAGHDITVTSITSYVGYNRLDTVADDGVAVNATNFDTRGSIQSFSQELRAANGGNNRLKYTVGANIDHSFVTDNNHFTYSGGTTTSTFGFNNNDYFSDQDILDYAGFGDLSYDLTDQLTLKGGLRYTVDQRNFKGCTKDSGDGTTSAFFTAFSSEVRGSPIPPIAPGACWSQTPQFLPAQFTDQLDQANLSYQGGVDYKLTRNALLYVNITKGYKAGGFPTLVASENAQYAPVSQESVLDYEGGFKVELLNRSLFLTGAGFYYDYTNKQVRGLELDPTFGLLPILINIPKSSITGGELAASWTPVTGLATSLSLTYLDATISQYSGLNIQGAPQDFAGSRLPFASKLSFTFNADYIHPITEHFDGFIGGDVNGRTSQVAIVGADSFSSIKGYALLDLRGGVATHDGVWRLSFYGKNVLNKYYWVDAEPAFDTTIRYAGRPATYGATLSYRFR